MPRRVATASIVLFAYALLPASDATAASRMIGVFEKNGKYWQQVKITASKREGQYLGAFEVATKGCTGGVEMSGTAAGPNSILFEKRDPTMEPQVCRINVNFSADFRSITVSHEYCGYSGAACDFNGTLKRKGR